ncbi:MAG: glycoside hydrolase family 99-like domain-containing protein [Akkermansiaceae bacterium]
MLAALFGPFAMQVAAAERIPPPIAVDTGPLLVGAIHCPLWDDGRRWQSLAAFPDREPLLGFYDEGDPDVTDWEIKWALEHGISFFLTCWYREAGNSGRAVKPALDHWVSKGLPRSRFASQIKFALMFENGHREFEGGTSRTDLLENLLPFWIKEYFKRPNYLALDGRPVLAIYNVDRFIGDLGGADAAREVIGEMRAACVKAGFAGLSVLGQSCWGNPQTLAKRAELIRHSGMDASFAYHLPTFTGAFRGKLKPTAEEAITAQEDVWKSMPQPNIPTLSMGWDSEPWGFSESKIQWRLSPEEYKNLCQRAKSLLDSRPVGKVEDRLVLLDNWNEFGEGHYLMPTRGFGFGHLDAVREVFAPLAPPHTDIAPLDHGFGPYDARFRSATRAIRRNR